jgi:Sap-like sulfolipid-1-addressing protein
VSWIYSELVVVSLAAMLSPTTLTFSVLALVLGDRPLRTGLFFYIGALTATLAVGVAAAFVLGDVAASETPSEPKTWVAILDVIAATFLLTWVVKLWRNPPGPEKQEGMVNQMGKVASSPAIAVVGAGAALANPGAFIPIALKTISETDPTTAGYAVQWLFFTLVSLLPLLIAIVLLVVAPGWAGRILAAAQRWLTRHAIQVAIVIIALVAVALLRNGIAGLTS